MSINLTELKNKALKEIADSSDIESLNNLKVHYLGRKGALTEVLRSLSSLPIEERKQTGEAANILRQELEALISGKEKKISSNLINEKLLKEKIDVFLPQMPLEKGSVHPVRQTMNEVSSVFESLGFKMASGPEIETEWYNFEALNIPKDHPARDTQDTFYLMDGKRLLRTHTSPVQVHVMESTKPPLRIIAPGRVYRNEATDASHLAVFHQIEGLAIDENITFSDLKGVLTNFVKLYFGPEIGIRFRASHFQFTEPSAEVDVQCTICSGKGCRVCKHTGWLEMLGSGMVHPNVLRAVKIDPEKYQGFAFGMGLERLTLLKHGIDDIRLLYENKLEFLKQF